MTSNDDILRALGRVEGRLSGIEESVSLLREDVSDEKDNAHESRSVIHRRLDEQAKQIAHLDTTVAISGGVDATLRDEIKALKETVEKNHDSVQPALDEWRRMKTLGYGISGLIAFAGLTIGGMIAYASDGAVAALRHWLKIN
ncbi:membrane protein [Rhizobium leguminosarum]|uniref:membrane protein n=1 Tax=Rhizobium leguminosarum TaxID=384 RepID=UPI0003768BC2|nr:membrane protein [Rhizobium leguminosarum]